jgi:hypothetical protein
MNDASPMRAVVETGHADERNACRTVRMPECVGAILASCAALLRFRTYSLLRSVRDIRKSWGSDVSRAGLVAFARLWSRLGGFDGA